MARWLGILLGLVAAALPAQPSHGAATRGSSTVVAIGMGTTGSQTLPSGTPVWEGLQVVALSGSGDCLTTLSVDSRSGEIGVLGGCVPQWPGAQSQITTTDVVVAFTALAPATGQLALDVDVAIAGPGNGSLGAAAIDVDDDGTDDLATVQGPQSLALGRSFGATPVVVRLRVAGLAFDLTQVTLQARVRVLGLPQRFLVQSIQPQGVGCPGGPLQLWGDAQNRGLWVSFRLPGPNVAVFGAQRTALALQPGCWLYVQPAVVLPVPATPFLLAVSPSLQAAVFAQAFGVFGGQLNGSAAWLAALL